jgi:hypothetical protein
MKLFLALIVYGDECCGTAWFSRSTSRTVFVLAPSAALARKVADDDLDEDFFYEEDGNTVEIFEVPGVSQETLVVLDGMDDSVLTYVPPAPVARPTMFVGTFRRDAGPCAIQFVELLKKEIVKGLFNNVDPTDGAALMRAAASKMLSSWGLLVGAMDSELRKGGMPEGTVESLKEDLLKVPFGTNTYLWELVYVPDAGIGYYTLGAYRRG